MPRYRNPFHRPPGLTSGPEFYETQVKPVEYRGYLIYERIKTVLFDVVKNNVLLTTRRELEDAQLAVDERIAQLQPFYPEGAFYALPEGWTWADVARSRRRWGINPKFAPLSVTPGLVVAWGRPMITDYRVAA